MGTSKETMMAAIERLLAANSSASDIETVLTYLRTLEERIEGAAASLRHL